MKEGDMSAKRIDDATLEQWASEDARGIMMPPSVARELLAWRGVGRDVTAKNPLDWEWMCCRYCRVDALPDDVDPNKLIIDHEPTCPYRRAVELVGMERE